MSTNNRASLLAGLRTGGVRSTSGAVPQTAAPTVTSFPRQEMPMTAAVGGSFNQMYAQAQAQAQAQAFQMQMMQMEIMRLQVSSRFLKQIRRLSRSEGLITTLQISFCFLFQCIVTHHSLPSGYPASTTSTAVSTGAGTSADCADHKPSCLLCDGAAKCWTHSYFLYGSPRFSGGTIESTASSKQQANL